MAHASPVNISNNIQQQEQYYGEVLPSLEGRTQWRFGLSITKSHRVLLCVAPVAVFTTKPESNFYSPELGHIGHESSGVQEVLLLVVLRICYYDCYCYIVCTWKLHGGAPAIFEHSWL